MTFHGGWVVVAPYPGREAWMYEGPDRDYWPWTLSPEDEEALGIGLGAKPADYAEYQTLLATNLEPTLDYLTKCKPYLALARLYWLESRELGIPWDGNDSFLDWIGFDIINPANFWSLNCEVHRVGNWRSRLNSHELFVSEQDTVHFLADRNVALRSGAPIEDPVSVVTVRVARWRR